MNPEQSKLQTLYQVIGAIFCTLVVLANILSAKMVALPWLELSIPAGLFFYPLTFLCSDLVTEIFGAEKSRIMVTIALGMSFLSFGMIEICLALPSCDKGIELAFQSVLGYSNLRILSSVISYVISQIAAIYLYTAIRQWTGPNWLWLRNNGSTGISQMIDTILIDLLFLWWGLGMSIAQIVPIMFFSFGYKLAFSAICTPVLYLFVFLIRKKQIQPESIQTQGSFV